MTEKRERPNADRLDEILGAAETLQWARDCDAGEMMLDLFAEIEALKANNSTALSQAVAGLSAAIAKSNAEVGQAIDELSATIARVKPHEDLLAEIKALKTALDEAKSLLSALDEVP